MGGSAKGIVIHYLAICLQKQRVIANRFGAKGDGIVLIGKAHTLGKIGRERSAGKVRGVSVAVTVYAEVFTARARAAFATILLLARLRFFSRAVPVLSIYFTGSASI